MLSEQDNVFWFVNKQERKGKQNEDEDGGGGWAVGSFETSVNIYQRTWRHIPYDSKVSLQPTRLIRSE